MKNALILLFFLLFVQWVGAQDLILKNNGDSIPCVINDIGGLYITYLFNQKGKPVKINMALKEVKEYQFNVLPADPVLTRKSDNSSRLRLFIAAGIGAGNLTAPVPDDLQRVFRDYYNELQTGFAYHVDGTLFFNSLIGAGIHFSRFETSNELDNVIFLRPNDTIVGTLRDRISLNYLAPCITFKLGSTQNKASGLISGGVGYATYRNNALQGDPYRIEGRNIGLHISGTLEYNLTYELAIFGRLALYSIFFHELEVENLKSRQKFTLVPDEPDNNSRVDLQIGLRYAFGKN